MSDPKPTIRIASCREDGRCPGCLGDRSAYAKPPAPSRHPCGCACCGDWRCFASHLDDLLTEALRQLSEARAAIRELDEARDHSKCWPSVREQVDRAMFASHTERERAEKAEALLREALAPLVDRGMPCGALVARIREALPK